MPEGDGLQERKGRFKIKQVEAAEAEEASYPEGDILGGRIKGPDRSEGGPAPMALHHHHLHQHNPPRLDADNSGVSAMSDLTDSVGKSMNKLDKSEKKGRFIIRELPEVPPPEPPGSTGSSSSTSHHVHIDPHPHVYAPHHPAAPPSSSHHTRPPPHPYGSQASMNRPSSNQHLDGHGSGSLLTRPSSQLHLDSSSQHDLAFRVGDSPSGQPYSPLFHSQFPSSSSLQDVGWIDPEMARIIRQQNELILQRLAHMDKTFHQHMSAMPATTPADKAGLIKGKEGGGEPPTSTTTSATTTTMKDTSSGKLTYLLDQMKNEVESAVSKRRELDLQMKRLQEKNRALEEKVDEEKAKRIAAEKKFEKMREKSEQLITEIAYYQEQFAKLSYSTSSSSTSPIQIPPSSTPQQGGGGVAVGGGQLGGSGSGKIGDVTAQQQLLQQQAAQSNASFSDFMQASFNAPHPSSTSGTSGGGGAAGTSKAHMSVEKNMDDFASLKPSPATGLPARASSSPIPVPGHKQTGSGGHLDQSIGGGPGSGGQQQQQQRGGSIGGSTAPSTAGGGSAAATDPFNALISNVAGLGLGSNPGSSSCHATRTSLSSSNNNHHHSTQSPTDDAFAELVNRSTSGKPSGPSPSNSSNNLKGQGHARRDSNLNLV